MINTRVSSDGFLMGFWWVFDGFLKWRPPINPLFIPETYCYWQKAGKPGSLNSLRTTSQTPSQLYDFWSTGNTETVWGVRCEGPEKKTKKKCRSGRRLRNGQTTPVQARLDVARNFNALVKNVIVTIFDEFRVDGIPEIHHHPETLRQTLARSVRQPIQPPDLRSVAQVKVRYPKKRPCQRNGQNREKNRLTFTRTP